MFRRHELAFLRALLAPRRRHFVSAMDSQKFMRNCYCFGSPSSDQYSHQPRRPLWNSLRTNLFAPYKCSDRIVGADGTLPPVRY